MKRILIFLLCLFLLAIPMTVSAASLSFTQTISLTSDGSSFKVEESPGFWEHPTLKAGDTISAEGTLTIRNQTMQEQRIGLRTVQFPYDDSEALRYLNHLHITIKDGSTVLYDGMYSRINDGKLFMPERRVKAGESISYLISLSCDYTYSGPGFTNANDMVQWEFYAIEATDTAKKKKDTFSDPTLVQLIIAVAIAAAAVGGVFAYDRFFRAHR